MPWLSLLAQAGCAVLICLLCRPIAVRCGLLDMPDQGRKLHEKPTPLIGGIAVMVPVLLFVASDYKDILAPQYWTILIIGAFFFLVGLSDDRRHVPASKRLTLAFIITAIVLAALPGVQGAQLYFGTANAFIQLGSFAAIFFALCLVGLVNAFNMADGQDGVAIGMSIIWTGGLLTRSPEWMQPILIGLLLCLAVALIFNLRGKLFLGDNGSHGIAGIVGLLVILAHIEVPTQVPAEMILMWFLMPVADCIRIILLRLGLKQSPFTPDRSHLHHILSGWLGHSKGLVAYWAMVAGPVLVSLNAGNEALVPLTMLTLLVYISGVQFATAEAANRASASSLHA